MQFYTTKNGLLSTSFGSIKIIKYNKILCLADKNMLKY